jgi:aspartate racemase
VDKVVGVIGGLGPDATLDFYAKLLLATPAERDQDHLRVVIDSNPKVPDRNHALAGEGESPGPALAAGARALERAGAQLLCMPCNTAHAFIADVRAATALPFVSIIDAALAEVRALRPAVQRIGLLTADGGRRARVYEDALARAGLHAVQLADADQAALMQLIYGVKAGRRAEGERIRTAVLAQRLVDDGAQALVAGCTEVPLLMGPADAMVPFIDSTAALARAVVRAARGA